MAYHENVDYDAFAVKIGKFNINKKLCDCDKQWQQECHGSKTKYW